MSEQKPDYARLIRSTNELSDKLIELGGAAAVVNSTFVRLLAALGYTQDQIEREEWVLEDVLNEVETHLWPPYSATRDDER